MWASWLSFMPDHALDSILDACGPPVTEDADGTSAQIEIDKQPGSMDGTDLTDSFVFDEYAFINQETGPISTIGHDLFIAEMSKHFFFAVFAVFAVQNPKNLSTPFIDRT